jgi:hypothetical protein
MDYRGSIPGRSGEGGVVSLCHHVQKSFGTQEASYLKKEWNLPPPSYIFMAWYLVKHRANFTFRIEILTKFSLLGP